MVVHFSTSDLHGGAAKAAFRLHCALRAAGSASKMIVIEKLSDDSDVLAVADRRVMKWRRILLARLFPRFAWRWGGRLDFNTDLAPAVDLEPALAALGGKVDVICLHWITGLLSVRTTAALASRYRCPIVWVLQDLEPLTGGCHYPGSCDGFARHCGRCPQLGSRREHDRSRVVWQRKKDSLSRLPLTLVAGSTWLSRQARKSALWQQVQIAEISDAIDTQVFRPFDQRAARDLLHLPQEAHLLFFGAFSLANPRKGMEYLLEGLRQLHADPVLRQPSFRQRPIHLVVAGHENAALRNSLPFPHTAVGFLQDNITLALAYQAADVFLCPSVEDAGPMMIPEAMLCGTPVVAFETGIALDLIPASSTGYLARLRDSADFSRGIVSVLTAPFPAQARDRACATAVSRHCPSQVAAKHGALYELLSGARERNRL